MTRAADDSSENKRKKKPYQAPKLEEYGSVAELTANTSAAGNNEGSSGMVMP